MSRNIDKLGRVIANRAARTTKTMQARTNLPELGKIDSNLALIPDNIQQPIPREEYMIDKRLKDVLKPGNRVVIVWAGMEPVVVAVIVSS